MNFGGRGGMGNMSQMIKQAQAMQAKMMQAQEEPFISKSPLENIRFGQKVP